MRSSMILRSSPHQSDQWVEVETAAVGAWRVSTRLPWNTGGQQRIHGPALDPHAARCLPTAVYKYFYLFFISLFIYFFIYYYYFWICLLLTHFQFLIVRLKKAREDFDRKSQQMVLIEPDYLSIQGDSELLAKQMTACEDRSLRLATEVLQLDWLKLI